MREEAPVTGAPSSDIKQATTADGSCMHGREPKSVILNKGRDLSGGLAARCATVCDRGGHSVRWWRAEELSTSSGPNTKGGTKIGQAPNFDIGISHDGTFDIVTVQGEIDLVTAPLLSEAFVGLGSRIIVDLRAVSFMDSSGLAVLIQQKSQMEGGELRIVADGSAVLRLFELSGLTAFFEPTPDLVPPPKRKPKFQSS